MTKTWEQIRNESEGEWYRPMEMMGFTGLVQSSIEDDHKNATDFTAFEEGNPVKISCRVRYRSTLYGTPMTRALRYQQYLGEFTVRTKNVGRTEWDKLFDDEVDGPDYLFYGWAEAPGDEIDTFMVFSVRVLKILHKVGWLTRDTGAVVSENVPTGNGQTAMTVINILRCQELSNEQFVVGYTSNSPRITMEMANIHESDWESEEAEEFNNPEVVYGLWP